MFFVDFLFFFCLTGLFVCNCVQANEDVSILHTPSISCSPSVESLMAIRRLTITSLRMWNVLCVPTSPHRRRDIFRVESAYGTRINIHNMMKKNWTIDIAHQFKISNKSCQQDFMIISGVCDPSFRLSHFREICKYDILFRRANIPMSVYNTFISILFRCCIHNQNTHIRTHAPPLNMLLCEWQIRFGLIKIRLQLFPNQNGDPKIINLIVNRSHRNMKREWRWIDKELLLKME